MMLKVVVFLVSYMALDSSCSSSCNCGYGGLCINDIDGINIPLSCDLCAEVSSGFYETRDCDKIFNHCSGSPCVRGICQRTFGSYYCECPEGWMGQNCQLLVLPTDEFVGDNKVHLYYQVQPPSVVGPHPFTVVYDLRERQKDESSYVQLSLIFVDGRIYIPKKADFVLKNIKEECVRDALSNREQLDIKVCDYLPTGEVHTFTVDAFSSIADSVRPEDLLRENTTTNQVLGRKSRITVVATLLSSDQKTSRTLFTQDYSTFSYFFETVKRCRIQSEFVGCATDVNRPYLYSREGKIFIRSVSRIFNCQGVFSTGTGWFLQRHINPEDQAVDKDFVPRPIENTSYEMEFCPFSLSRGLHMLEFVHYFRGLPPHYGGPTSFLDYSRCWIAVTGGQPHLMTEGGNRRTMSCHSQMALPLINANHNYKLSDFLIEIRCNETTDIDCKRSILSVPVLRKSTLAKCGSSYEYTIDVQWQEYTSFKHSSRHNLTFKTVIHFIPTHLNLKLECLFNCYPIDPSYKILVYAVSHPYFRPPVNWSVTSGGMAVDKRMNDVNAFSPLTASRILRLYGHTLVDNTTRTTNVTIESSYDKIVASMHLLGDNLNYDGAMGYNVSFSDELNQSVSIVVNSPGPLTYPVGLYSVYEVNRLSKDYLPLVTTSYEADLNNIKVHWTTLRICVRDARHVGHCLDHELEGANTEENRVEHLIAVEEAFACKNVLQFLCRTVLYTTDLLTKTNESYFTWPSNIYEREHIINRATLLTVSGQKETSAAIFMASIFFYSEDGNKNEGIHPFVEETRFHYFSPTYPVKWATVRHNTLLFLERTMMSLNEETLGGQTKADTERVGSRLEELIRVWSLAHAQGGFAILLTQILTQSAMKIGTTSEEVFLMGEMSFLSTRSANTVNHVLEPICGVISKRSRLFYGILAVGLKHTRAWATRTTYQGILNSLNKSNERVETGQTFTDFIFGNPLHLGPENELLRRSLISLPPAPDHWDEREFVLIVILVENRMGDLGRSPNLLVRLTDKDDRAIEKFPGEYNITLPVMINGTISTNRYSTRISLDVVVKPKGGRRTLRNFNAYKVTLPDSFKDWEFQFFHFYRLSFKAKVFFNTVPDFEETFASPEIRPTSVTQKDIAVTTVNVKPEKGEFLPRVFYVGILPADEKALRRTVDIYIATSIYFCKIDLYKKKSVFCKGLAKNVTKTNNIECHCDTFGLIYAVELFVGLKKILLEPIEFVDPALFHIVAKITAALVMTTIICAVMGIAYWKDRRRMNRATLINPDDNYVEDSNPIIIGVYTGLYCLAGATTQVAIKIEGSSSSSRVHILHKRTQKTLQAGEDDWFIILTNKHLGIIKSIRVWLNYEKRPHWYCDKIFILDVHSSRWYVVHAGKWMELDDSEEKSRFNKLEMKEVNSTATDPTGLQRFTKHYLTEMRNNHVLASMFLLHTRSLNSFEQMSSTLIIDILSIFWAIWWIEEVAYTWIYNNEYLDTWEAHELIGIKRRTFTTALLGALLSGVPTLFIRVLYRSVYVSKFYQRRTTNAVFMDPVLSSEVPGMKSMQSLNVTSFHNIPSRKSTKYDMALWSSRAGLVKRGRVYAILVFGPTQFRCVDVDWSIFQQRAFRNRIIIRSFVLLMVGVLLAGIIYVEFITKYWKKRTSALFLTAIAFLMDVFIVNPLFIMICSYVSVYGLKVSNTELSFIHDDMRVKHPPVVSYSNYIDTATKKEYKPPLSSESDASRMNGGKVYSHLEKIHFIIATALLVCCARILSFRIYSVFGLHTAIDTAWSQPNTLFYQNIATIDHIYEKRGASDFVMSSLVQLDTTWYNGKPISKDEGTEYTPLEFIDIFARPPCGFLSDNSQVTKAVEIHEDTMNYTVTSSRTITGRSGEVYRLAGHSKSFESWQRDEYYITLRLIMNDLTNLRDSCEPRAVIFVTNLYNTFLNRWITLELLIEFHPTGFSAATLNFKSGYLDHGSFFTPTPLNILGYLVLLLSLLNLMIFITLASTVGPKIVKEETLKCFFVLAYGWLSIMICFHDANHSFASSLLYDNDDEFHDLGPIYTYDMLFTASMVSVVVIVLFKFSSNLLKYVGTNRLNVTSRECIRRAATLSVMLLFFNSIVKWCLTTESVSDPPSQVLHTKFMASTSMRFDDHDTTRLVLLSAAYVIMIVLFKLCTAAIMITYCSSDAEDVSWLETYMRKMKALPKCRNLRGKGVSSFQRRKREEQKTGNDRLQTKLSFME